MSVHHVGPTLRTKSRASRAQHGSLKRERDHSARWTRSTMRRSSTPVPTHRRQKISIPTRRMSPALALPPKLPDCLWDKRDPGVYRVLVLFDPSSFEPVWGDRKYRQCMIEIRNGPYGDDNDSFCDTRLCPQYVFARAFGCVTSHLADKIGRQRKIASAPAVGIGWTSSNLHQLAMAWETQAATGRATLIRTRKATFARCATTAEMSSRRPPVPNPRQERARAL